MISQKFIKSSLIYTIAGALPLASGFILLPFYANLLSTTNFGLLALYISITFIFQIIAGFSLDSYISIYYFDCKDDVAKLKKDIGTISSVLLIIAAFLIVFSVVAGNVIFNSIFKGSLSFFPFGFMSVLTAIFNIYFKTYTTLLISQQRPERYLWLNLSNFVLTILISLIGLYLYPDSLIGPMWGRLLSGAGIFLLAFYFFSKEFGIYLNKELIKPIISFCFPMLIYGIFIWCLSYFDRFVINNYMDASKVAIYDFAIKCTFLIDYFQTGLTQAIFPKIYTIWKNKNLNESTPEVNSYHNGFTAISLLAIPLLVIAIPLLVPLVVYNKDYFLSFGFLAILSISFTTRGLLNMYHAPIIFFKKTKVLPKIYLFIAIFQIISSIILIKYFNLTGAVYAVFITKILQVFFTYLESRKIFKYKFNKVKLIWLPLICVLMVIFSEQFIFCINRMIIEVIQLIIIYLLVYFIYKNEILMFIKEFKFKKNSL
jgi:O-antigen/teichoic acid export membrane protein